MNDFLKKIKIIDYTTITLSINKTDFVKRLNEVTDFGSIGTLSSFFDGFSSSKNVFKGEVHMQGFKLKRIQGLFDNNSNFAVAQGTFTEKDGELIIETEINGFSSFFYFYYSFIIIFYTIFIFSFSNNSNDDSFFVIPFILFHGIFMSAMPYFLMRRSVKRLKYEIEREFFYLTKRQ